jgi:hypothetical protein
VPGTIRVVGTARCAVRAAFSGAIPIRSVIRGFRAFRSARWTRAGTSQRDVPTFNSNSSPRTPTSLQGASSKQAAAAAREGQAREAGVAAGTN